MDYSAASYFDGFHFQHIAAWIDHQRVTRRYQQRHAEYCQARGLFERRTGSRIIPK